MCATGAHGHGGTTGAWNGDWIPPPRGASACGPPAPLSALPWLPACVFILVPSPFPPRPQGCVLGNEVGFKIRFMDNTKSVTRVKYMTDGCLVREILTDPTLEQYSVVMLDEAHERSIDTGAAKG